MSSTRPSLGRIVIYHPHESGADIPQSGERRDVPAVIVRVWSDVTVNLKVLCDGPSDFWVQSAPFGTDGGHWSWPVIIDESKVDPRKQEAQKPKDAKKTA